MSRVIGTTAVPGAQEGARPAGKAQVPAGSARAGQRRVPAVPGRRQLLSIAVTLAVLQLLGVTGVLSRDSFPLASSVLARFGSLLGDGAFWQSVGNSLGQALTGLAAGTAIAVPLGLALGRIPLAEKALRPIIEFLRPIPSVALLPLVILTAGVGLGGAVLLTGLSSLWLVLVMCIRGARAVDPTAEQTLISFGVPAWARLRRLVLPSALPFIVTGVRIAASVALVVAITVELLGGMPGLGKDVSASLQNGDKVGVYAYALASGVLGLIVNFVFVPIEDRLLSWHSSRRAAR
ncbi:NitT/TauT family transport system permease protein [Actinocorallia herbida]|uniref:NitT/TauT family transport system permease protein n=1 Tax=Actinocorallia herbida TaxID=58109 RepID=A0A3N1CY02_9ACTN|nr:ABC transporter permease [Actinocorallia herbida]ROO86162.1 NitT/TauT family transport system permease protein [Actinocorallia herbida]